MCNASEEAKQAAARDTQLADCSKGAADRSFNDHVFELATFDPDDDGETTSSTDAPEEKPTVLHESLTVTVAPR